MKKIMITVFLLLIVSFSVKADVIYDPTENFGTAFSFECIGSYEFTFLKNKSLDIWGGFGVVSMIMSPRYPSMGTELAVEIRRYFQDDRYENFNVGFYTGVAFMQKTSFYNGHLSKIDNSVGIVPGIKLTYKKSFNSWLIAEPYVSLSLPLQDDNFNELFSDLNNYDHDLVLTFGIRLGFSKVRS